MLLLMLLTGEGGWLGGVFVAKLGFLWVYIHCNPCRTFALNVVVVFLIKKEQIQGNDVWNPAQLNGVGRSQSRCKAQ